MQTTTYRLADPRYDRPGDLVTLYDAAGTLAECIHCPHAEYDIAYVALGRDHGAAPPATFSAAFAARNQYERLSTFDIDDEPSAAPYVGTAPSRDELERRLHALCHDRSNPRIGRCVYSPQLRAYGDSRWPLLGGYLSLWNCPTTPRTANQREILRPGAFNGVLARNGFTTVRVGHHEDMTIADTASGTLALLQDDYGLVAIVKPPRNELGRGLIDCIRSGEIAGMSYRLSPDSSALDTFALDGWAYRETFRVRELTEISFVANPSLVETLCVCIGERRRDEPSPYFNAQRHKFMQLEQRPR